MVCIAAACGNERSVVLASDQMFTVPAPNNLEFETRKKEIEPLARLIAAIPLL